MRFFENVKKRLAEYKLRRKNELRVKKFHIRNELIRYYMDLKTMGNVVDIPAHIYADRAMKLTLRTPMDIDRSYRKLLAMKRA